MSRPLRLGILVSGRGSNFEAIATAIERRELDAQIVVVICNHRQAPVIERAQRRNFPTVVLVQMDFPSRQEHHFAMGRLLTQHDVDLVVTAGFDRILDAEVVRAFDGRIVNIHPSLLPAFPGLHAQADALAYGVRFSGCTVHFVSEELDAGPILLQAVVPVYDRDTPETLADRILEEEHKILPRAIQLISEGRTRIEGRRVLLG